MNAGREVFAAFLNELQIPESEELLQRFDRFLELLLEKNKQINLFSRTTTEDDLWTKHFLDSLVPLKCIDFVGKKALDFGTGAGLPGIPLKLAVPDCRMTLLDSVRKKTLAVQDILDGLELADCDVVCERLEDHAKKKVTYDLILCRAVRLEERYLQPMQQLLTPQGRVLFYKAQDITDIEPYQPQELFRAEFEYGLRTVQALDRVQLKL